MVGLRPPPRPRAVPTVMEPDRRPCANPSRAHSERPRHPFDALRVAVQSWASHDDEQPWGGDDLGAVLAELGEPPGFDADLAAPDAAGKLVARARDAIGPLTGLVVNHARSSGGRLAEVTAAELDLSFAVNARAAVLLSRPSPPSTGRRQAPARWCSSPPASTAVPWWRRSPTR